MNFGHIQTEFYGITCSGCCMRIYTGCHVEAFNIEVQEYFCSKQLVNFDCRLNYAVRRVTDKCL